MNSWYKVIKEIIQLSCRKWKLIFRISEDREWIENTLQFSILKNPVIYVFSIYNVQHYERRLICFVFLSRPPHQHPLQWRDIAQDLSTIPPRLFVLYKKQECSWIILLVIIIDINDVETLYENIFMTRLLFWAFLLSNAPTDQNNLVLTKNYRRRRIKHDTKEYSVEQFCFMLLGMCMR